MSRLAETEAHIASMSELLAIVGAMRSLAGMRMQEAQRILPGTRRYADMVASAISDTLLLMGDREEALSAGGAGRAVIVCTAEHGFVGGFNNRLVEAAEETVETGDTLFMLGTRGAALATERGMAPGWSHPMSTRCAAVPQTVGALLADLYGRIAAGEIGRVEAIFACYRQGGASTVERRLLLPLDTEALEPRQPRQSPLVDLDPLDLHERLIGEYLFALMTEAAIESIASENAARFATMSAAHENVADKVDELRQEARQARQSEITTELLDLVTGADAQLGDSR